MARGRSEQLLAVEKRSRADSAQRCVLSREANVQRVTLVFGRHRDGRDAEVGCRTRDSDGNLAPIGDQEFAKRHASALGRIGQNDLGIPKTCCPTYERTRLFAIGAVMKRRVSRNLRSMSYSAAKP